MGCQLLHTLVAAMIEQIGKDYNVRLLANLSQGSRSARDFRLAFHFVIEEQIQQTALASEKVRVALDGKEPKKIIVIKSRLVNIVV